MLVYQGVTLHPSKKNMEHKTCRFGSDHVPFQMGDFVGSMFNFNICLVGD